MTEKQLPWHEESWARLVARAGALPHALLLRGRSGLGKTALARRFAAWLLCEADPRPGDGPCGECPACGWFGQGNHPDFRMVESEALGAPAQAEATESPEAGTATGKAKPSRQIKIDQIRALADFLAVGTHRSGLRIALIRPAEAMNLSTANGLLKALEEPPPRTLFLLVSSQPARLLPTLRSRCQAVDVPGPTPQAAIAWLDAQGVTSSEAALAYTGLAPLEAIESNGLSELREVLVTSLSSEFEPVEAVDRWQQFPGAAVVDGLQKWVFDALHIRTTGRARYFPGHERAVATSLGGATSAGLAQFARRLARARAEAQHPLNPRLFLESLALEMARLNEASHVR